MRLCIYTSTYRERDDNDDDDSSDDGAMGGEGSLRSETFIIHAVRDHRFELIRRRSFAGKIKIILYINLISLYGRSILCQWQIFQWAL